MLDDLPESEQAAYIAQWGGYACAPWSLIIDYHQRQLTPEEFTAYAAYSVAVHPVTPGEHEFPLPLPIPTRYEVCDVNDEFAVASLELTGMLAAMYLEDIDPEFRDRLWLWHAGQTYEDATRLPTDEEINDLNCQVDPDYCN